MFKALCTRIQYLLPTHLLSTIMGRIAECRKPWLKNFFIKQFIRLYKVDMSIAAIEDPTDYPNFNSFFIRELKPGTRPIVEGATEIACPVDGVVAECGRANKNILLQAKDSYFDLEALLGGDTALAHDFHNGSFATLYLAPHDYHRVHMPVSGELLKTLFVPGKLFSVNRMTTDLVPQLYCRNERYISLFNTDAGPMIVILVGAMIVGSIKTVWMEKPISENSLITTTYPEKLFLAKGEELGYFKMGSTVIVLFQKDRVAWSKTLSANLPVKLGQFLGNIKK